MGGGVSPSFGSGSLRYICQLPPGRLTWNIIMEVGKMIFFFQGVIYRFHVKFPGTYFPGSYGKPMVSHTP